MQIKSSFKIDLIIFDLDGTLVDSQAAIAQGVNFALENVGLRPRNISEIIAYIGTGMDDLIKKSLGPGHQELFLETKSVLKDYRKNSPDNSSLYPGVKELLEYFKHKKKAIVTNREYAFAQLALKNLGIADYFEDILGGDNAQCMKPSACPLDKLTAKFNIEKEKTVIVGDMDIDILAGKGAGIVTCAVTYGIGKKEDILKAGPDYIINNILELKKIFN